MFSSMMSGKALRRPVRPDETKFVTLLLGDVDAVDEAASSSASHMSVAAVLSTVSPLSLIASDTCNQHLSTVSSLITPDTATNTCHKAAAFNKKILQPFSLF